LAPPFWTVDPAWRGADAHGPAHEAVARFEECRRFSPDFGRSYIASAIIYSGAGQSEKAREPLEELLVRHPDDEGIHSALEKIGSKMRMLRVIASCLVALPVLAAFCAASDEVGIISGTVRDVQSKPVEGAKVTLTSDQPPAITKQTISSREGLYRFAGLHPGKYHVAAEMSGFVATAPEAIESFAESASPAVDFKLTPLSSAAEPKTTTTPESRPPIKFEVAGVRALISAGGMSAPASAAAASGLIEGIANIKRAGNGYGAFATKDWPCGLEPELRKAVAANPDQGEANRRLGEFYVAHNQAVRAIPFFQRAREIDRADDLTSSDLAVAWMKNGQFDSARELLETLLGKQPTPETHRLLARADEGSGMFAQACQQYQLAAQDEHGEEDLFGVGYELILAGLPPDAARAFESGLKQHPRSIKLLIGAGTAEFLQGHTSEALLFFLQASDLSPSDPRPYSFLANASGISRAESARVSNSFKRFLDLTPGNAEASYFYAVSLLNGRDADAAVNIVSIEALLKRAIALDPGLARAHIQLGVLYEGRGDYEGAAREYETTIRLAPDINEAHYRLAGAYRRSGRGELASREMQLFQQARERETSKTDSEVGIEQFVSVIDRSGPQTGEAAQCPEVTP